MRFVAVDSFLGTKVTLGMMILLQRLCHDERLTSRTGLEDQSALFRLPLTVIYLCIVIGTHSCHSEGWSQFMFRV